MGAPGDERILDIESHTELMVGMVLSARPEVVAVENQVPFRWRQADGRPATHFLDFRANLIDGTRIAVMVKSAYRLRSDRVRRELDDIAARVTPDFADHVCVMTEEHLDRIETHNATIMHDLRESEPETDAAARRMISGLHGEIRTRGLSAFGLFAATSCCIYLCKYGGAAMIETKIRKVGNSAVMTLTTEMLTILDAKEGDSLFVVRGDDGSLKVMAHDPSVAEALVAAELVMDENRDMLQALA